MASRSGSGLIEAARLLRAGRLGRAAVALGRALRGLSTGGLRRPAPASPPPTPAPTPAGAGFVTRSFTGETGSRDYKLYTPARRSGEAMPLLLMLHGCTQSPDDFAAGTRMNALAEEHGLLVAYPIQSETANPNRCWNWFDPASQHRDGGEAAILAGIVRQILAEHPADPDRVYVAGLSAGGAAAAILAAAYPDLFAAAGIHSGLPVGAARNVPGAFAAMRRGAAPAATPAAVPTIVIHGDADKTVHPANGDAVLAQALAGAAAGAGAMPEAGGLAPRTEQAVAPGGHAYSRTVHADAAGRVLFEQWVVHGAGHAWIGGSPDGSYTDPQGPDASREMLRFFLQHRRAQRPA